MLDIGCDILLWHSQGLLDNFSKILILLLKCPGVQPAIVVYYDYDYSTCLFVN